MLLLMKLIDLINIIVRKVKKFYESDYCNGIAKGLAEARNAVDRTLSILLEVKGDKEKAEYFVEEVWGDYYERL